MHLSVKHTHKVVCHRIFLKCYEFWLKRIHYGIKLRNIEYHRYLFYKHPLKCLTCDKTFFVYEFFKSDKTKAYYFCFTVWSLPKKGENYFFTQSAMTCFLLDTVAPTSFAKSTSDVAKRSGTYFISDLNAVMLQKTQGLS